MECRLAYFVRDEQVCPVGGNSQQEDSGGGNLDAGHLSTGGGYLRDDRALGSSFVKVKTCTISPDEILWIAVVSDRHVS